MIPFSLLVKPVGSACNLRCRYCFYSDHAAGVMSEEICRRMLESYAALPFAAKSVALQGGEPLLAPSYVFDLMESAPVERSIQTNATLVTPECAERLRRGGWLVGASLDGDAVMNRGRVFKAARPAAGASCSSEAFDAIVAGVRNLERSGVDYNLLAVVSKANVGRAGEVYRYFRETFATKYYQFIECTGPCEEIGAEEWGEFLCALFDEWVKRDVHEISIRLFDSIVSELVDGVPTQCSFASSCRQYLVVEHDGSVYPCDFHVRDDLRLGNVMTDSWEELVGSPKYAEFAAAKCAGLEEECRRCEYFRFCRGDCPRNREGGRSKLCAGWKRFFAHALPRLLEVLSAAGL